MLLLSCAVLTCVLMTAGNDSCMYVATFHNDGYIVHGAGNNLFLQDGQHAWAEETDAPVLSRVPGLSTVDTVPPKQGAANPLSRTIPYLLSYFENKNTYDAEKNIYSYYVMYSKSHKLNTFCNHELETDNLCSIFILSMFWPLYPVQQIRCENDFFYNFALDYKKLQGKARQKILESSLPCGPRGPSALRSRMGCSAPTRRQ